MTRPLSIMIIDADRYFSHGLGLGLQLFFKSRQQQIHLLDETQIEERIDIVFFGDVVTSSPWLYQLRQRKCRPTMFFIKEHGRNKNQLKPRTHCDKCNTKALYRHQPLRTLYDQLDNVLFSPQMPMMASDHDCSCMYPLTPREEEVLRCIHRGMNGHDTGAYLHISNKTANAHKQNAMRKLNFRCNQELYHWLLQGGGRYLNERIKKNPQHFPLSPKTYSVTNLSLPA